MKLTQEEQNNLILYADNDIESYGDATIIEESDWTVHGKYQSSFKIIEYKNHYYQISDFRTGSPYTDYTYETPLISEVIPKEKTVILRTWEKI